MGLIRKAIFIGGVIFALPSAPPGTVQDGQMALAMPSSTSWTYIAAAADAVADVKGFCDRKPQVCSTAQYLAVSMEGKAKYSAKLIYEWANESTKGQQASTGVQLATSDPAKIGTLKPKLRGTLGESSTLTMEDLVPEWHGTLKPEKG